MVLVSRQGVGPLQGGLQPRPLPGRGLPDAAAEHGRPLRSGSGAAGKRNWTKRRFPSTAVPAEPEAGG